MSASDTLPPPLPKIDWQPNLQVIMPKLEAEVQILVKMQQENERKLARATKIAWGIVAFAVIAVVCIYLRVQSLIFAGVVGVIIAVIALVYWVCIRALQRAVYSAYYKNEVFQRVVKMVAPTMDYQPQAKVAVDHFTASGLFRSRIDRYDGEDMFRGSVGDTSLMVSELRVQRREESRNAKGHTSTHWVVVFDGLFMVLDFHKAFQGHVTIESDFAESTFGWLGRSLQQMSSGLVRLENPDFEKAFKVCASDPVEACYLLTPNMQEYMLELRENWGQGIQFALHQSLMYIAIPTKKNWFDPCLKEQENHHAVVLQFTEDLLSLLRIVETLHQNTRLWSKS